MLSLDDPRWTQLKGGYRVLYDPRPMLLQLEAGTDTEQAWHDLWNELHHQGDVGEASYAAVPHLVRIHRQRSPGDWNTYAMVGIIELARGEEVDPAYNKRKNPEIPDWLKDDYFEAIGELAEIGVRELPSAQDPDLIRGIFGILALQKGARTYARFLLNYSEEEVLEMEAQASEISDLRSRAKMQRALESVRKK
jgi:hypothetical protein